MTRSALILAAVILWASPVSAHDAGDHAAWSDGFAAGFIEAFIGGPQNARAEQQSADWDSGYGKGFAHGFAARRRFAWEPGWGRGLTGKSMLMEGPEDHGELSVQIPSLPSGAGWMHLQ